MNVLIGRNVKRLNVLVEFDGFVEEDNANIILQSCTVPFRMHPRILDLANNGFSSTGFAQLNVAYENLASIADVAVSGRENVVFADKRGAASADFNLIK